MTPCPKLVERYQYDTDALIGDGGFAVIYRAQERESRSNVALKILKREFEDNSGLIRSFFRDAQTTRDLSHRNIIRIMGLGTPEEAPYFVAMEYCPRGDLKREIQRRRRLPLPDALRYAIEISDALQYCHQLHVFHRDIKASNILFRDAGIPVLSDFSNAMNATSPENSGKDGPNLGSPPYMSPEAWTREDYTAESELYSFGVLMYYMLTGVQPFTGDSPEEFRKMHLHVTPPPASSWRAGITRPLAEIVGALLEKRPQDRMHSAEEVKRSLVDVYRQFYEGTGCSDDSFVEILVGGPNKLRRTVKDFPFRLGKVGGEGKGLRNDLVIRNSDPFVSRFHAIIERFAEGFAFIDISTNGSEVNGMRVHKRSVELLRENTVIIGKDTRLQICIVRRQEPGKKKAFLRRFRDFVARHPGLRWVLNGGIAAWFLVLAVMLIRLVSDN